MNLKLIQNDKKNALKHAVKCSEFAEIRIHSHLTPLKIVSDETESCWENKDYLKEKMCYLS